MSRFCLPMISRTLLIALAAVVISSVSTTAFAQTGSRANSQQIDPVRVGDDVEVKVRAWHRGTVRSFKNGVASVEFEYREKKETKNFSLAEIRFPNGEGCWQMWKDDSGKFTIIARYRSRTETHVTLITESGKQIEVPIAKLATEFQNLLKNIQVSGPEAFVDTVDPLRVGDQVEFKDGRFWRSGTVTELSEEQATISYTSGDKDKSKSVDLEDMAFANGQGPWMTWSDESKKSSFVARYINRSDSQVTLLTEDDRTITLEIDSLAPRLQALVNQSISWTPPPKKITFPEAFKKVNFMSGTIDFAKLAIDSSKIGPSGATPKLADGGIGFPLSNGDQISMVKPFGDDGWIAIGTYSDGDIDQASITRLYWANPVTDEIVNGPGFSGEQQIIDYSATDGRLLTATLTSGVLPTVTGLCTYRITPGAITATPEYCFDLPKPKNKFSRDASYKARLVNDHQLLLVIDGSLSLYDFESSSIVYEIAGLDGNNFQLHPSGKYVLARGQRRKLLLYKTSSGKQIGLEASTGFNASGFSQDGTQIVGVTSRSVYVWDMTQNVPAKKYKYDYRTATKPFRDAELFEKHWVWTDGRLYDTDKEALIWSYKGGDSGPYRDLFQVRKKTLFGSHVVYGATIGQRASKFSASQTAPTVVIGITKIPHKTVIERMNEFDAESMKMLKPGIGVRIEAEGDPRIRKGIERAIAANGWKEDPNSKIVIAASAKLGESQTEVYEESEVTFSRLSGRMFKTGKPKVFTVTYTPWLQRISMAHNSKKFFVRGDTGFAPTSSTSRAELDEAVKEAGKPNYSIFENLELPTTKVYSKFISGFGSSRFTEYGLKDKLPKTEDAQAETR